MAFNFPTTVNEAAARSADAPSDIEELDNIDGDAESVNGDDGDTAPAETPEGDEPAEATGEPENGTRSTHVKRENFDKVNNDLKEARARLEALEAAQAAPVEAPVDEWAPVRQEFEKLGLRNPAQAAAALAQQQDALNRQIYEQENAQIHERISSEINYADNPTAYDAYFRAERSALDLHKQATTQARSFALQRFPDADVDVINAFGASPQQIEAIAQHTHTRIATVRETLTKEFETKLATAKEQAVLEYIQSQKQQEAAAAVERGGRNASPRSAPAAQPRKLGSGFHIPVSRGR